MFIHSFESMAARDGEGIRCMVFLSGCMLNCVYCHNPDTQKRGQREITPEELTKKIVRYKPYFRSGGGVTFSGGEPLLQSEEIVKTATLLNKEGINYALDTSLALPLTDSVKKAIEGADMILADLKFWDSESMKEYTKGNFEHTISALDYIKKTNKRFILRTVVVPEINDNIDTLEKYIPVVEKAGAEYWELLPFHTMGFFKYEEMNIINPLKNTPSMPIDKLELLKEKLRHKTDVKIK